MNKYKEALETLKYEVFEEGHCSYIENEISVAIEALEKAVPKKLKVKNAGGGLKAYTCECGACIANSGSTSLMRIRTRDSYPEMFTDRFCPKCGQAIDWSVVDEPI